jgi:fructose-1,6-bisphosphatase I
MAETLENWLESQNASADIRSALACLADAAVQIASAVESAPLKGNLGAANNVNVQGEDQKILDVMSNDISIAALQKCPEIRAMVSEEVDHVMDNPGAGDNAGLAVCLDPLDGSSNIETNGTIGTIFSILRLPANAKADEPTVLGAVRNQVAAGYFLYGAANLLVVTTGKSVAMFAYNPASGKFELARPNITIPKAAAEFSINMAHGQFWQPAVRTYIDECLAGKNGPRGKTFNMRWAGSMVSDVHRVFARGGIFIYPALAKKGSEKGKLRLLYEGIPMSMLVEVAGGKAVAGDVPFDQVVVTSIHERTPLALGSAEEVDQLVQKFQQAGA